MFPTGSRKEMPSSCLSAIWHFFICRLNAISCNGFFFLFDHFSSMCDNLGNVAWFSISCFQLFIYQRSEYNRLARACRHLH